MKSLIICLIFLLATKVHAQNIMLKGKVTEISGQPLPGVSIIEKGTTSGTITNSDGMYSFSPTQNATLVFSFIGMETKEIVLNGETILDVVLSEASVDLEQVVVTGYTTEKKAEITGAVSVVKMKEIADIPTGNVLSSLQGRVPGVDITTDGTPGGFSTSTLIRGTTTINDASPLYVIDGIMTRENMSSIISANDIESIQVLKDAASASIYGAQAANGVIIITTKKAKKGEIKVNFDMSFQAQTFNSGYEMLDAYEWGDVYWQAYENDYGTTPSSIVYGDGETAELQEYYYDDGTTKIKSANTDWLKEIYSTSFMQNYSLTLGKGSENGSTSLSLNYIDQDGLCRNTNFTRYNIRLGTDYKFLDNRLRIGANVAVNRWTRILAPDGIEEEAVAQHPAIPIYDENGNYAGGYVDILGDKPNMIRLTDNEKNNRHAYWRIFGNTYIELEPIKNLTLKSNLGINYYNEFNSVFVPAWQEGSRTVETNELTVSNDYRYDWILSNTVNYRLGIGKHSASVLLGMEAKENYEEYLEGYGTEFDIEDLDYRYLDAATSGQTVSNYASTYSMVSYFGKINYAYDNKYLLSSTVRRDASSRFGANNNAGIFPSVSVGWRMSRELFMKNIDWLSDLKLRTSWGINGNDMIDNEATYSKYIVSLDDASYNISGDGTTLAAGAYKTLSANSSLKWEQTTQTNFGIDAAFFRNRLGFSFDWFYKSTEDMLIKRDYIAVIGEGGYYYYNGISMDNNGLEATVTWRNNKSKFNYEINFNVSYYKNEITDLPEDIYYTYGDGNGVDKSIVGQPYGSWMGYKSDGLFKTQEEVDEYTEKYDVQVGSSSVGRIRYKDLNDDYIIDSSDQTWLGSDNPKIAGGLNLSCSYKGFDLSMFINGMIRDAWNNSKYYTDLFQCWTGNHSTDLLKAMKASQDFETTGYYNSDIPALTTVDNNNESRSSDFYVENGSFVKLKSLTLGYSIPRTALSKLKMRTARVYFQAQNIFTLTGYTGADPEGLGYTYPLPRSFTLGLSVGF